MGLNKYHQDKFEKLPTCVRIVKAEELFEQRLIQVLLNLAVKEEHNYLSNQNERIHELEISFERERNKLE